VINASNAPRMRQLSPASGQEWKSSRHVRCRSFLRFKDCGRAKDSPTLRADFAKDRTTIYPLTNTEQIASHLSNAAFCTSFSKLAVEASPRARLQNRDHYRVCQVGMMKSSPATDGHCSLLNLRACGPLEIYCVEFRAQC
jgi:hypothetical protein